MGGIKSPLQSPVAAVANGASFQRRRSAYLVPTKQKP
jgi:hypothetical protein